jgi:hypothetical protein
MGKKCIPGVICIENMTLFILVILFGMVIYLYYALYIKTDKSYSQSSQPTTIITTTSSALSNDPLTNLYAPPLKNDGMFFRNDIPTTGISSIMIANNDIRGPAVSTNAIPVNIQTRGFSASYSQIGILTRSNGGDMILPLMGRRIMNGRNKLQYYSISNTGNMNTKLPISVNGRSCSGEYGCDEINNGDMVYVEGYNDTFRATVYENGLFSYIPI